MAVHLGDFQYPLAEESLEASRPEFTTFRDLSFDLRQKLYTLSRKKIANSW